MSKGGSTININFRDASGAILCFDLTNHDSFDAICDYWLEDLNAHAPAGTIKVLCGLKADLDT